ncbi:hypothetical protein [Ammoniphilus sp. 3BR4]|uniref:hypothetical protein n=1 Tax=Ammoniphilus sp. 3BR4 TaxID=3158265 RepID=UPI0034655C6A
MDHDHSFISKFLKRRKERNGREDDQEFLFEMAVDLEFPHTEENLDKQEEK